MRIEINDIIRLIDQEIQWCENNRDDVGPADYTDGFIDGLTHSKYLIKQIKAIALDDD